jgi:hypothetical protein
MKENVDKERRDFLKSEVHWKMVNPKTNVEIYKYVKHYGETLRRRITLRRLLMKYPQISWKKEGVGEGGGVTLSAPHPFPQQASEQIFKGTVSRDFLLLVFLMNQFPPSPRVLH